MPASAIRTAEALTEAGIQAIELTFTTPSVEQAVRAIAGAHPEITLGAGTVTSAQQAQTAAESGAAFLWSAPHHHPGSVQSIVATDRTVIAGCISPTEILAAQHAGAHATKIFPANAVTPTYLRALRRRIPRPQGNSHRRHHTRRYRRTVRRRRPGGRDRRTPFPPRPHRHRPRPPRHRDSRRAPDDALTPLRFAPGVTNRQHCRRRRSPVVTLLLRVGSGGTPCRHQHPALVRRGALAATRPESRSARESSAAIARDFGAADQTTPIDRTLVDSGLVARLTAPALRAFRRRPLGARCA